MFAAFYPECYCFKHPYISHIFYEQSNNYKLCYFEMYNSYSNLCWVAMPPAPGESPPWISPNLCLLRWLPVCTVYLKWTMSCFSVFVDQINLKTNLKFSLNFKSIMMPWNPYKRCRKSFQKCITLKPQITLLYGD